MTALEAGELDLDLDGDLLTKTSVADGDARVLVETTYGVPMVEDSGGFILVCAKSSSVEESSLGNSSTALGGSGLSGREGACSEVSDEADVVDEARLGASLVGLELKTPVVV